jgi:adenine-specific DNA methylase
LTVQEGQQQKKAAPKTRRLIEEWLPIAALSEESIRERRSMTALPPTYYLHVWWARRPLVASRAAVLASLLPADADHKKFLHGLGIHGDPVAAKLAMDEARRTGKRIDNPYDYARAFAWNPSDQDRDYVRTLGGGGLPPKVLDSTAGGGSIPFEAMRLGCDTYGNDLNPVAWLVLKATVEFPERFGPELLKRYKMLASKWLKAMKERIQPFFPTDPNPEREDATFLLARTIKCPYCNGIVPLSPNWKLNNKGAGVRLVPRTKEPPPTSGAQRGGEDRVCAFEIVRDGDQQSAGTVKGGDGLCPFPDCGRVIDGDEIKAQAKAGKIGEQLYAVVYTERKIIGHSKNGKPKIRKTRCLRAPRAEDDNREQVHAALAERMPDWQARNIVPDEERYIGPADRSGLYGVKMVTDMYSPRQLLGHCTSVEVFHELVAECGGPGNVSDMDKAALTYLCFALDKALNYNSRMSVWMPTREVVANTFNRHDFAFCWSHAEMALTAVDLGYDWTTEQTAKALKELIELVGNESDADDASRLDFDRKSKIANRKGDIVLSCGSGDHLPHLADASIDAVVLDPPYYDNVMYAELADFFYVWLKRTAGLLFPEQFADYLTDKDREAVANPAKFKDFSKVKGSGGAKKRAARDYQERMQAIFAEARRVLKPEGIMTLMFTHKATGAWDALAKGLVDAGFVITASWPIQTEAEGSLHIKDKNAAKSTIFLVCRPREAVAADAETTYWENVEPKVTEIVAQKVGMFEALGMTGVDLYLSCFGPALEVFSKNWPIKRGRANQRSLPARGAQLKLLEDEEWDPYAVRPEDALMAARSAVKQHRMFQLTQVRRQTSLDPVTEWFILAWDAFKSPQFPADEALKLARVVGVNFDDQLRGNVLEIKGGDVIVWDSGQRAKKGVIGSMTGTCRLDALHHVAQAARERNIGVAKDMLERSELHKDSTFLMALEATLNVLPTPRMVSGKGVLAGAAADAEALEKLRKLMFANEVPQANEWMLFDTST